MTTDGDDRRKRTYQQMDDMLNAWYMIFTATFIVLELAIKSVVMKVVINAAARALEMEGSVHVSFTELYFVYAAEGVVSFIKEQYMK